MMTLQITSTELLTHIDGVRVRVWEGVTENGIPCKVLVHRIAVHNDQDCEEFDRHLAEQLPPGRTVPLREVLP